MFYSQFILAKKGPLGTIWIAAHLERKLRKHQIYETNISVSVDSILFPEVPIALRLSGHLLLGVVRIYSRKVGYLFADCSDALVKIKQAFHTGAVDLPPEATTAPYHSITMPETFDLDTLDFLPDVHSSALANRNRVDLNVTTKDQITLQDSFNDDYFFESQIGPDERFEAVVEEPMAEMEAEERLMQQEKEDAEAAQAAIVLAEGAQGGDGLAYGEELPAPMDIDFEEALQTDEGVGREMHEQARAEAAGLVSEQPVGGEEHGGQDKAVGEGLQEVEVEGEKAVVETAAVVGEAETAGAEQGKVNEAAEEMQAAALGQAQAIPGEPAEQVETAVAEALVPDNEGTAATLATEEEREKKDNEEVAAVEGEKVTDVAQEQEVLVERTEVGAEVRVGEEEAVVAAEEVREEVIDQQLVNEEVPEVEALRSAADPATLGVEQPDLLGVEQLRPALGGTPVADPGPEAVPEKEAAAVPSPPRQSTAGLDDALRTPASTGDILGATPASLTVMATPDLAVEPTPIEAEEPRPPPRRRAPTRKRKTVVDAATVLPSEMMRQQLTDTQGIRRVRSKPPHTSRQLAELSRQQAGREDYFAQPALTDLPHEIVSLYHRICVPGMPDLPKGQENAAVVEEGAGPGAHVMEPAQEEQVTPLPAAGPSQADETPAGEPPQSPVQPQVDAEVAGDIVMEEAAAEDITPLGTLRKRTTVEEAAAEVVVSAVIKGQEGASAAAKEVAEGIAEALAGGQDLEDVVMREAEKPVDEQEGLEGAEVEEPRQEALEVDKAGESLNAAQGEGQAEVLGQETTMEAQEPAVEAQQAEGVFVQAGPSEVHPHAGEADLPAPEKVPFEVPVEEPIPFEVEQERGEVHLGLPVDLDELPNVRLEGHERVEGARPSDTHLLLEPEAPVPPVEQEEAMAAVPDAAELEAEWAASGEALQLAGTPAQTPQGGGGGVQVVDHAQAYAEGLDFLGDTGLASPDDGDEQAGGASARKGGQERDSGWSARTRNVGKYLQTAFQGLGTPTNPRRASGMKAADMPQLSLDQVVAGKTCKEAARMFFETLVLTTRDYIHVDQPEPFGDVLMSARPKLMKARF